MWIYSVYYLGNAIILVWLINNTDSILIHALFHAMYNAFGAFFASLPNPDIAALILGVITLIVVMILISTYGRNLSRKPYPVLHDQNLRNKS